MSFTKVLCVIALAVCLMGGIAYAETQSVKISGDITLRSFNRGDYDLDHNNARPFIPRVGNQSDWQSYFMTTTEVQIDADLTDNVAGVIRLFNQRDWNVRAKNIMADNANGGISDMTLRGNGYMQSADEFDVGIDLAYVELKEFLYSPLTLKIGRQDIWFGKGFVVGYNQRDPQGTINANEYTCVNSFDGIRATLDYDPWTIDAIAVKIWENAIDADDDEDLWGLNVGYVFDVYNAEAEGYWFYKNDESYENWVSKDSNRVQTVGLRGSLDPIENWTVAAEGAFQWGKYVGSRSQLDHRDRNAFAIDASLECRHFQEQFSWKPKMGVEYIYYSGHKNVGNETPQSTGTYTGWDRMYRGKFDSAIREFQGLYYLTSQDNNNGERDKYYPYPDAADQNEHQIIVSGSVQPTDSLTVEGRYINFWQQYATKHKDAVFTSGSPNYSVEDNKYLGSEIDVQVTWDYTEDVSFGMLAAWYFPGTHYYDQSNDVATDLVGTVKLSF